MSRSFVGSVQRAFTRDAAFTAPDSEDHRLRGRTYAVPFDVVWQVSVELVDGGLRGWSLVSADDRDGWIEGVIRSRFRRFNSAVTLRIKLDRDAQTRVDAVSASPAGRADLGCNARRLGRFYRALDHGIEHVHGWPLSRVRLEPDPRR